MAETLKELTSFIVGATLCVITGYTVARSLEQGLRDGARPDVDEAIFEISRHSGKPTVITWIKGGN